MTSKQKLLEAPTESSTRQDQSDMKHKRGLLAKEYLAPYHVGL